MSDILANIRFFLEGSDYLPDEDIARKVLEDCDAATLREYVLPVVAYAVSTRRAGLGKNQRRAAFSDLDMSTPAGRDRKLLDLEPIDISKWRRIALTTFKLDGHDIPWGDASVEDHERKADEHERIARGHEMSAREHRLAAAIIAAHNVKSLNQVIKGTS